VHVAQVNRAMAMWAEQVHSPYCLVRTAKKQQEDWLLALPPTGAPQRERVREQIVQLEFMDRETRSSTPPAG
jgi:hypothetical protein